MKLLRHQRENAFNSNSHLHTNPPFEYMHLTSDIKLLHTSRHERLRATPVKEKIKRNQALLNQLNIKSVVPKQHHSKDDRPPAAKRRKVLQETAPARTSARIAATPVRPTYNYEEDNNPVSLSRSAPTKGRKKESSSALVEGTEPLVPTNNIEEIKAGWTAWEATAAPPTRDEKRVFHFEDYPHFTPNKSPEEMLREGCFGGSYFRPLRSRKLGVIVEKRLARTSSRMDIRPQHRPVPHAPKLQPRHQQVQSLLRLSQHRRMGGCRVDQSRA